MKKLLEVAYHSHYKAKWKASYVVLHKTVNEPKFEISDQVPDIVCLPDTGIAQYTNVNVLDIIIINYEKYINQYGSGIEAGKGLKCDFIVYEDTNRSIFLLNELTQCKNIYLDTHQQEKEKVEGKRDKSVRQLNDTITKLMNVPVINGYINSFTKRVGLFSYKLTDQSFGTDQMENPFIQSIANFAMPQNIVSNISGAHLKDGFVFEQRIYPISFDL